LWAFLSLFFKNQVLVDDGQYLLIILEILFQFLLFFRVIAMVKLDELFCLHGFGHGDSIEERGQVAFGFVNRDIDGECFLSLAITFLFCLIPIARKYFVGKGRRFVITVDGYLYL
jgi:hypothetical protein